MRETVGKGTRGRGHTRSASTIGHTKDAGTIIRGGWGGAGTGQARARAKGSGDGAIETGNEGEARSEEGRDEVGRRRARGG